MSKREQQGTISVGKSSISVGKSSISKSKDKVNTNNSYLMGYNKGINTCIEIIKEYDKLSIDKLIKIIKVLKC